MSSSSSSTSTSGGGYCEEDEATRATVYAVCGWLRPYVHFFLDYMSEARQSASPQRSASQFVCAHQLDSVIPCDIVTLATFPLRLFARAAASEHASYAEGDSKFALAQRIVRARHQVGAHFLAPETREMIERTVRVQHALQHLSEVQQECLLSIVCAVYVHCTTNLKLVRAEEILVAHALDQVASQSPPPAPTPPKTQQHHPAVAPILQTPRHSHALALQRALCAILKAKRPAASIEKLGIQALVTSDDIKRFKRSIGMTKMELLRRLDILNSSPVTQEARTLQIAIENWCHGRLQNLDASAELALSRLKTC